MEIKSDGENNQDEQKNVQRDLIQKREKAIKRDKQRLKGYNFIQK